MSRFTYSKKDHFKNTLKRMTSTSPPVPALECVNKYMTDRQISPDYLERYHIKFALKEAKMYIYLDYCASIYTTITGKQPEIRGRPILERKLVDNIDLSDIKDRTCSICLEEVVETNVAILKCGHLYHTSCIKEWDRICYKLNHNSICPYCREKIEVTEAVDAQSDVISTLMNKFEEFMSQWPHKNIMLSFEQLVDDFMKEIHQ